MVKYNFVFTDCHLGRNDNAMNFYDSETIRAGAWIAIKSNTVSKRKPQTSKGTKYVSKNFLRKNFFLSEK